MNSSEQELVRRALASALDRLESAAPHNACCAAHGAQPDHAQPAIIILMTQPTNTPEQFRKPRADKPADDLREHNKQATHPSYNKFDLESSASKDAAPKTCFIEPQRVCVNSGACEMLGY